MNDRQVPLQQEVRHQDRIDRNRLRCAYPQRTRNKRACCLNLSIKIAQNNGVSSIAQTDILTRKQMEIFPKWNNVVSRAEHAQFSPWKNSQNYSELLRDYSELVRNYSWSHDHELANRITRILMNIHKWDIKDDILNSLPSRHPQYSQFHHSFPSKPILSL